MIKISLPNGNVLKILLRRRPKGLVRSVRYKNRSGEMEVIYNKALKSVKRKRQSNTLKAIPSLKNIAKAIKGIGI